VQHQSSVTPYQGSCLKGTFLLRAFEKKTGRVRRRLRTQCPGFERLDQRALLSGVVYVSDLPYTAVANGWGPVEKDTSNGEQAAGDGHTITLHGVT